MITNLVSRAPTRIDLAGGTVDLWPLYLFLRDARTVNLGIDLYAESSLSLVEGIPGAELGAGDQNVRQSFAWEEILGETEAPPALALHLKLLRHHARKLRASDRLDIGSRLKLESRAKSPAGAGLGGSSALSVSMIGAISTWSTGSAPHTERDGERLIEIVRDTETTVIQVPAGLQDYYGAMFGGLQTLRWGVGSHEHTAIGTMQVLTAIEQRLLLFYSGQSRNSGINNWALYKAFIDRTGDVRERFQSIVDATLALESAIAQSDWLAASRAIAAEWMVRKTLAPGITTPEIDRAFSSARAIDPESSGKICGAGGGGCFFVFSPSGAPEIRERISRELGALPGVRALPFQVASRGLEVSALHA